MRSITYPLAVEGVVTRVIECGKGPAVVFVHGLGARCDRFAETVARYGNKGFRAITYDLPGHGLAQKGAGGPADVPALARYLLALLDALEIETAILVGTSLGGHIAAYAATLAPARVPGLGLIGALGIAPMAIETARGIQRNVKATSIAEITGKLQFVIADPALVTPELIEEEWRINTSPGANESFVRLGNYLVDGIEKDYVAEKLAALYPPEKLLLIWGALDKAVPLSVGEECRTLLKGPELALVEGAGHAPYFEQPERFDAVLEPFLAGLA
ncbi:alpha/beta fold hydrolase [Zavarzinia sp.]|uniref:alpha/beta fold hydrolase n=1 Tax=Zavarzinia sp. TaxID=2027920 RepID=UPI00356180B2